MTALNALMASVLDVLLAPFRQLPPIVGLSVVSLATALLVMLTYRFTSNQQQLTDVKRRIAAALYEIRLFNDDLPAVFRAQAELMRHNATYLRLSFVPMLWMLVPIGLLVGHLEFRYGYTGLTPGQPALVKVLVRDGVDPATGGGAALEAPQGISVLTPPVWFPASNEIAWRIRPDAPGEYELGARVGGQTFTKSLAVTDAVVRRSPMRVASGFLAQLMNPAERPLPDGAAVKEISVRYEPRSVRVFGKDVHWLIVFFVVSTVFALILKKPLGVTV